MRTNSMSYASRILVSTCLLILLVLVNTSTTYGYSCASSIAPDQSTGNTELQNSYTSWKNTYVTASGAGGFLRVIGDGGNTFSEGIGYGMILAAYMGDKPTFDGLWSYAKSHFDANGLMHWKIDPNNNVTGQNAATDGDEDMALALIVADKKWGGYTTNANSLIGKIMAHEVEANTFVLKPGDVWGGSATTNPSYFAPAYYKVFGAYTGNSNWSLVADKCYQIIANVNSKTGAGTTGLQPDWTTAAGDPVSGKSYDYTYDACRVPWRLAVDAAWYCDSRASSQLNKINAFFKGIGAANIKDGYRLDGTLIGQWHNSVFVATAAPGAIISADTAYKSSMWNEAVRLTNQGYFHDTLRALSILFMSGNMANPVATVPDPNKLILDDFESGNTGKWSTFKDASTTMTPGIVSPGAVGSYAMNVQYSIVSYGGVTQGYTTSQDWSGYQTFDFWFKGNNTGNTIRLEVSDNRAAGSTTDTSERFEYRFVDNWTGWRHFSLTGAAFQRRADWQPTGAPNDGFTLTQVWGFNFSPVGGAGSFQVDQLELVKRTYTVLDDFESGNTGKWAAFKDPGSTMTLSVVSPGKVGNYAMNVQYNILSYGGVSQGYPTPQDWGGNQAIEFWFNGSNTGNTIRLEVSDNRPAGSTSDTSERFEYRFVDNFTGWKFYSVPWSNFMRRGDWQPVGAPNDGFTLTQVWGFNFAPISGTGNFQLDQVQLMK
jgi:endo-1,4-beta-D-glucanase Y